ncbi:MAG: secretion system protein YukD [Schleiferilactobacillus perolens]|jgi:hypothetical protein|uniref:secretion system protein YukD n=1 Tax=Schleiferilactobacillus perolens TaxID=100468 RepID=UPI0039E8F92D|nr:secretion system protein YukD [Schleiferilactobacillus harbinensis]
MTETAVNIEVEVNDQVLDMRVPDRVSVTRLRTLLMPILSAAHIQLPANWYLQLTSQKIAPVPSLSIAHYSIVNGDRFKVVTGGENNGHNE